MELDDHILSMINMTGIETDMVRDLENIRYTELKHDGTVPMFLHQSRCRISPYYLNIISHKVSYFRESLVYKETHECTRQWWGFESGMFEEKLC